MYEIIIPQFAKISTIDSGKMSAIREIFQTDAMSSIRVNFLCKRGKSYIEEDGESISSMLSIRKSGGMKEYMKD